MPALPSGTVTFLFTDIAGSTVRWERHPNQMRTALARHDTLLHEGITAHDGVVVTERGEGDSFFALFARPSDALAAACAVQRALAAEPWPQEVAPLQVRMALHTGYERDYERARAAFSADLATTRVLGDTIGIAVGLTHLGDVARAEGDLTGAATLYEESLALWRDLGSVNWGLPWTLLGLGDIGLQRGDHVAARTCFAESLLIGRQEDQIAASLESLAALAGLQGQPGRALRLAGAATALRERIDAPPWPADQAALMRKLAAAREVLSAEEQAAAWAEGQALTLEQAIAEALAASGEA